ncbi:Mss4-like protein [Pseudocohnilembus persalinus]|uniref:Peptide-methionine (R)-S-oxide reductase n=1 Tax=Pseudocohnilembus persalinus TaxID=266149 RepID=A0A0V0QKF5_PSEPJ|nr:Mss4-like protein [Pseudocohnilembus persalinus]|eukprot:KRX02673.1 Mss4-like protein [Pseudocohnilembus persalinus]
MQSEGAVIKHSDMNQEMQQEIQESISSGIESNIAPTFNCEAACKHIKEDLDKKYGPTWQCIIGEGFAYNVSVQDKSLMFLYVNGNLAVLFELKKKLSPLQYKVTQDGETERPYTGKYNDFFEQGVYQCVVCETDLFKSESKYNSSCGWPSFFKGIEDKIKEKDDFSHGMFRTEVLCKNCGSHLGHKFNDGPKDKTGIRYCINSVSLNFKAKQN